MSISLRALATCWSLGVGVSTEHKNNTMHLHPLQLELEQLPSPFSHAAPDLSECELRETAYEILVAACRSSGPKQLIFISQSGPLERSLSWRGSESKVNKTVGPKRTPLPSRRAGRRVELMRAHMRVPELTDTTIRRALLRLGRRIESMVLPFELIQQFRSSDFPNQQEYEAWLRRNLKVLEAGLVLHPRLPLHEADTTNALRLRQIIGASLEKPMDIGNHNNSESMQALRSVVMSLAFRSCDGSVPETSCHWADGFPLNLKIYQTLLGACFANQEETCVNLIEEVDEVLELIKNTWVMLGMNQMLHNICFSWVLFHRYVATGQVKTDLLVASSNVLAEAEKDVKAMKDPICSKSLSSTLSLILSWAEKRLLAYHDTFRNGTNIETMQSVVSLAVSSAKMLVEDVSLEHNRMKKEANVSCTRVENYIRSSLFSVFSQKLEKLDPSKHVSKKQNKALLGLSALARDISELAFHEKAIFSPVLKRWHPLAAGVAVATLHMCYGNELKQYVRSIPELTPDTVEVLLAADNLEKDLVQIAVEDSIDSEDGGISIIREMHPYAAESIISNLANSWIKIRVDRLEEWVERNLQLEEWNPGTNKECFAPSAVEVLRIIDDTLEEFFLLPIPMHAVLLPELISGLDNSLQHYILKAKSGCGNRNTFVPTMPPLTRCSTGSKFHSVFKKKEKSQMAKRRNSQVENTIEGSSFGYGLRQLCVLINTMQRICIELKVLENRTTTRLRCSSKSTEEDNLKFKLSAAASAEGVDQLSEATAYKVIFHDLCHVLWDGLYVGDVSSTRIEPFLEELEQCLAIISSIVRDTARTLVITEVMEAAFEGFLLVLLAGGPSRAFALEDSVMIEEDFRFMTDLFWSNGDGLPDELIEEHSTTVKSVLPLFSMITEHLIQQFSQVCMETCGSSSGKSRFPTLASTSCQWSPREPNTLLRVLCHRNDETAAKFLKKNYNLPRKI